MINIISDKLYSTKELAAVLHVKPETPKSWRKRKKFSLKFHKVGGAVKYLGQDVIEWWEERAG